MVFLEKKLLRVQSPTSVFGARQRLGTIIQAAGKGGLHSEEALFDLSVVMDEIFYAKLDALAVT